MVCLEIGAACRGLMYKLEAITWGLILACTDSHWCLVCWAWISSDFFDFAFFSWFWCISMVCLEIGTTCRGLMYKLEAMTWGLILACRDHPWRFLGWAWISSDVFDFAWFSNGSGVFQWRSPGD